MRDEFHGEAAGGERRRAARAQVIRGAADVAHAIDGRRRAHNPPSPSSIAKPRIQATGWIVDPGPDRFGEIAQVAQQHPSSATWNIQPNSQLHLWAEQALKR